MKVVEQHSDRQASAHIYIEGRIAPLKEYGQYVDPNDKAICCYVPINEGDKVKIRSWFSGTVSIPRVSQHNTAKQHIRPWQYHMTRW